MKSLTVVFALLLLGWTPESDYHRPFWDFAEEVPGCWIIQREIKKAVSGEPFFIQDETGKPERFEAIKYDEFIYYYNLWENYHHFGYPQGLSWLEVKKWFNDILKRFENMFIRVENLKDAKRLKGIENG